MKSINTRSGFGGSWCTSVNATWRPDLLITKAMKPEKIKLVIYFPNGDESHIHYPTTDEAYRVGRASKKSFKVFIGNREDTNY